MARDERRFKMADHDGDMRANKEEFTAFLHPEEFDYMKDIIVLVRLDNQNAKYISSIYLFCYVCSLFTPPRAVPDPYDRLSSVKRPLAVILYYVVWFTGDHGGHW